METTEEYKTILNLVLSSYYIGIDTKCWLKVSKDTVRERQCSVGCSKGITPNIPILKENDMS